MGMRPASRMTTRGKVGATTAILSLLFTVVSIFFAYKAVEHVVLDTKSAFLAIFGLLLVVSINS